MDSKEIDNSAHLLLEDEIGSVDNPTDAGLGIVSDLLQEYSSKIYYLSSSVYGNNKVALAAFKEHAANTIYKSVCTYLFKSQHWRTGRKIGPYIAMCLNRLADHLRVDADSVKRNSIPVCPGCKSLNQKDFLTYEGKALRCPTCTKEELRLRDLDRTSREEYEYKIRKIFSLHSRKGHRCPSCHRFIPDSHLGSEKVSCIYDDCYWFGIKSELEPMAHPTGLSSGVFVQIPRNENDKPIEFDAKSITADVLLLQTQNISNQLDIIKLTLDTQKARIQKSPKNIKKILMYNAFNMLLESNPEDMLMYITQSKNIGDRPIQSLIFQKYVQLVENNLPIELPSGKEAYSLLDPELELFLGQSEFQSVVRDTYLIHNNTYEGFTGIKCNGPCFIGWLCDVKNIDTGKSLLNDVEHYTFANIKMKDTVSPGTKVNVVHFRIPPHYEMYSLVLLQRTRRKIVDSVYKRLHGESRPLRGFDNEKDQEFSEIFD